MAAAFGWSLLILALLVGVLALALWLTRDDLAKLIQAESRSFSDRENAER